MTAHITGIGAVANVGGTPEEIFEALCAGRENRAPLRVFDTSKYRARHAYEIDDRQEKGRDEPRRATRWLITAIKQALTDAGVGHDLGNVPVLVGTTLREQRSVELWWRQGTPFGLDELHFGSALREEFGASQTHTFANACAAALYALGLGADLIELGTADTVVVAGADSIAESAFGALDRVQRETPDALRSFDESHRGMLMGEGAAAVVLQRAGTARCHARLRAVSLNCDAYHVTAPDRDGISQAIHDAHQRAGLQASDIDLVMLHGSGTPRNDETEASALSEVFAGRTATPLMTAIKSMTGHTLGGSGLLSLIVALLSFRTGLVPPVLHLDKPISQAAGLRLVRGRAEREKLSVAQIDAFGFGGINAVAILESV